LAVTPDLIRHPVPFGLFTCGGSCSIPAALPLGHPIPTYFFLCYPISPKVFLFSSPWGGWEGLIFFIFVRDAIPYFRFIPKHSRARTFLIYIYARTRTQAFLCFIAYFALLPQNTPKNSDFVTRLFSMLYKESAFFLAFFCKNIWSYQKKAVPLHSLLRNK